MPSIKNGSMVVAILCHAVNADRELPLPQALNAAWDIASSLSNSSSE